MSEITHSRFHNAYDECEWGRESMFIRSRLGCSRYFEPHAWERRCDSQRITNRTDQQPACHDRLQRSKRTLPFDDRERSAKEHPCPCQEYFSSLTCEAN